MAIKFTDNEEILTYKNEMPLIYTDKYQSAGGGVSKPALL